MNAVNHVSYNGGKAKQITLLFLLNVVSFELPNSSNTNRHKHTDWHNPTGKQG